MFMYSYCFVCSVLCILFHCVVLCTVVVYMCAVLLPPGVIPIAVDKIYQHVCLLVRPSLCQTAWNSAPNGGIFMKCYI